MPGPLNYTTQVPVSRTVGEVAGILAAHGATEISTMYEAGQPTGMRFTLVTPAGVTEVFRLPVLIDGVHRLLLDALPDTAAGRKRGSREQAERVAWRQIKDWVAAQTAIVEAGMATLEQVMLPYLQVDQTGTSLYQAFLESERKAIR